MVFGKLVNGNHRMYISGLFESKEKYIEYMKLVFVIIEYSKNVYFGQFHT